MPDSNITKQALAGALKALLTEKPFGKISVGAICEACGMNRKSFYYHFRDKYELVEWIYDTEFIAMVKRRMRGAVEMSDWDLFEAACVYFDENRAFYRSTLAYDGQNSFSSYFRSLCTELVDRELRALVPNGGSGQARYIEFLVTFFVDAITASLRRWIMEDDPVSVEEYVKLMHAVLCSIPQRLDEQRITFSANELVELLSSTGTQ